MSLTVRFRNHISNSPNHSFGFFPGQLLFSAHWQTQSMNGYSASVAFVVFVTLIVLFGALFAQWNNSHNQFHNSGNWEKVNLYAKYERIGLKRALAKNPSTNLRQRCEPFFTSNWLDSVFYNIITWPRTEATAFFLQINQRNDFFCEIFAKNEGKWLFIWKWETRKRVFLFISTHSIVIKVFSIQCDPLAITFVELRRGKLESSAKIRFIDNSFQYLIKFKWMILWLQFRKI